MLEDPVISCSATYDFFSYIFIKPRAFLNMKRIGTASDIEQKNVRERTAEQRDLRS